MKWGLALCTGNMVYGYFLVESQMYRDPRQNAWWLMQSPLPTYLGSVFYVLAVTWIGPRLMKNREPFSNLRSIMILYNVIQVVYSAYLVWE
ncbi:Elongation of very long chain fatty acids protein 7, partial [Halocaridina rubra]